METCVMVGWNTGYSSGFVFDVPADLFGPSCAARVKCPRQQAARLYVKHELIFQ
jgi:hypothetical protein